MTRLKTIIVAMLAVALAGGASIATATVTPDTTYGGSGVGQFVSDCSAGQFSEVVAGSTGRVFALEYCGGTDRRILALDASGNPDPAFGVNGEVAFHIPSAFSQDITSAFAGSRLVTAPDGSVYAVFFYTWFKDNPDPSAQDYQVLQVAAIRFDSGGSRDKAFGSAGVAYYQRTGTDEVDFARADDQSRLVLAASGIEEQSRYTYLARLTTAGKLDPTFSSDGRLAFTLNRFLDLSSLVGCGAGKIVMAFFAQYKTGSSMGDGTMFVRLTASGARDTTFSGDGITLIKNSDVRGEVQNGSVVSDPSCRTIFMTDRENSTTGDLNALDLERLGPAGTRSLAFASNTTPITRTSSQSLGRGGLFLVAGHPVISWWIGSSGGNLSPRITGVNDDGTRWQAVSQTGSAAIQLSTADPVLPVIYSANWQSTTVKVHRYSIQ